MRIAAAIALFSAAASPGDERTVYLFPALGSEEAVTVHGRTLLDALDRGESALSKNLRALKTRNWEGARVRVLFDDMATDVTSGHDGEFAATFTSSPTRPFAPGEHQAQAHVSLGMKWTPKGTSGSALAHIAPVRIVSAAAPFVVVSDFDDTVAVTNVVSKRGLVKAALLQDDRDQPVVPGMSAFYACLLGGKADPPGLAFVSGSPVQYAPRMQRFLERHEFPFAGLYLRNLGADTLSGYKQPVIRALREALPQPFILVGDSGEQDPEVYGEIRRESPERVLRIYIRDAGHSENKKRFEGMFLFQDPRDAASDAAAKGFLQPGCMK